jgi:hypothetical protein
MSNSGIPVHLFFVCLSLFLTNFLVPFPGRNGLLSSPFLLLLL